MTKTQGEDLIFVNHCCQQNRPFLQIPEAGDTFKGHAARQAPGA